MFFLKLDFILENHVFPGQRRALELVSIKVQISKYTLHPGERAEGEDGGE